jgi:formylglycine-generating enzyme required for sulfatase activity
MDLRTLLPTFIHIPAGAFLMGTPERELSALAKAYGGTRESYREESPQFSLHLPAFAIARAPVTNALYAAFAAASGARLPITWRGGQPPKHLLDHPVVDVTWEEANAFCGWLNQVIADYQSTQSTVYNLQSAIRLPTEAEWERAARGTDGRTFPWGGGWDAAKANTREAGRGGTSPVVAYPAGASPEGCLDMCGNVWEWTASLDRLYPYDPHDGREDPRAPGRRIMRGGCYANPRGYARCACRFRMPPTIRNEFLGFRLAYSNE